MQYERADVMVHAEWLFIHTIGDLKDRAFAEGPINRYETLGIAPLLRKLLTDGRPLATFVKGQNRPLIRFKITPYTMAPPETRTAPNGKVRVGRLMVGMGNEGLLPSGDSPEIKLDRFLKVPIGVANSEYWTVKQMIRYYSHVDGGVHLGNPEDDAESLLAYLTPALMGDNDKWLLPLRYVGQIVVDGLMPLWRDIVNRPTPLSGALIVKHAPADQ